MDQKKKNTKLMIIIAIAVIVVIIGIIGTVAIVGNNKKNSNNSKNETTQTKEKSELDIKGDNATDYAIGIVRQLKSSLNDPNSMQLHQVDVYEKKDGTSKLCIIDFGANNKFGGIVREVYVYENGKLDTKYDSMSEFNLYSTKNYADYKFYSGASIYTIKKELNIE